MTSQAAGLRPASDSAPDVARRNFIDDAIFSRMERDGVPHAGLASDGEFLRRIHIDLVGRIPTLEEVLAFEADTRDDKRDRLIDRLIGGEEFVRALVVLLRGPVPRGQPDGARQEPVPLLDARMADAGPLLRGGGHRAADAKEGKSSHSSPGAMYFARDFVKAKDDPDEPDAHDLVNRADSIDEFTVTYGKMLLGINLGCISCHDGVNHLEQVNLYLTGKSREDFFRQAAFFGRTRMIMNWENGFQANTEYTVDDDVEPGYPTRSESIVRVPRTGGSNEPKFILDGPRAPRRASCPGTRSRGLLTGHIQFARATANRIWAELMGVGIVEPLDGFDLERYYPGADLPGGMDRPADPSLSA